MTMSPPPTPSLDSERPIAMRSRGTSWAEVAMKVAHDGPIYGLMALVGILAIKGQAATSELIITGALSFVARSWPRPIITGGGQ